jgi:LmbE family N-acetylglucosaminyl deacetylase
MSNKKPTVLGICAHPDDAEFRCGGTLILLQKLGWDVHIATASQGDCGSAEICSNALAVQRIAEADAAARFIGATYHCLGGLDLQIYDDNVMRGAATAVIRKVNPDCIITHFLHDYMADHTATNAIVRTASFVAPMMNYIVGQAAGLKPTAGLVPLYYFGPMGGVDDLGNRVIPQFLIDVSSVIETKAEMLGHHASQRDWLRRQHGMDQYIEEMKAMDREIGALGGLEYAEGLFMHKGHAYPQTPVIEEALKEFLVNL